MKNGRRSKDKNCILTILVFEKLTSLRLKKTFFRGKHVAKSGNFTRWNSLTELIDELHVIIIEHALNAVRTSPDQPVINASFEINHRSTIGWSSIDSLEHYETYELEEFKTNFNTVALRVRKNSHRIAPTTRIVTVVCEIRRKAVGQNWVCIIHSAYPGKSIIQMDKNKLHSDDGNMLRDDIVFFDWNHPGEMHLPIPSNQLN